MAGMNAFSPIEAIACGSTSRPETIGEKPSPIW